MTWASERAKYGRRAATTPSRFLFEAQGEAPPEGWVGVEAMVDKDAEEPASTGPKKKTGRGRKKVSGRSRARPRR